MFKGPGKIVRHSGGWGYPVFGLAGDNCVVCGIDGFSGLHWCAFGLLARGSLAGGLWLVFCRIAVWRLQSLEIFLILILSGLVTSKWTVTYQCISNNHVPFHLWWKENFLNYLKVLKYYEHDCSLRRFPVCDRPQFFILSILCPIN